MSKINQHTVLLMLKSRLNRLDNLIDEQLLSIIRGCADEMEGTGIHLQDTAEDQMLLMDMAAWRYSARDKQTGMPDWLRLARRERWLRDNGGGTRDS